MTPEELDKAKVDHRKAMGEMEPIIRVTLLAWWAREWGEKLFAEIDRTQGGLHGKS